MGRGRGGASAKRNGKSKKKGLSCPDGACYLDYSSDSDSACSDSECSDCYEVPSRSRRSAAAKSRPKSAKSKPSKKKQQQPQKKKNKKSKRRDSSTSCSCSDCMDYSSDDSYNCPPARGRKCSTC